MKKTIIRFATKTAAAVFMMLTMVSSCAAAPTVCAGDTGNTEYVEHAEDTASATEPDKKMAKGGILPDIPDGDVTTVAKDGTGDFFTVQEAVDATPDGGTVVIMPGTYVECVRIHEKKVNLIGSGMENCIIAYDTVNYTCVPLEIAAGTVKDITLYGMHGRDTMTEEETAYAVSLLGDNFEKVRNVSGYAVHIEQDYFYGRQLIFERCRFVSENNQCVGVGTRGGSSLTFKGCEFINSSSACIFMHDAVVPSVGGKTVFTMEDCRLVSACDYAIALTTYNGYNAFDLKFVNVSVSDKNGNPLLCPIMAENVTPFENGWCGLCNTHLMPESKGNNVALMNYR